MMDYKRIIAESIANVVSIDPKELKQYIEVPPNGELGDYAFPCFKLAKELKKSPAIIANEIKEKIKIENNQIENIEIAGGYLNFYINKQELAKNVLEEIRIQQEEYGSSNRGEGKRIIIDYSSPNIAKPFHIGHLRSTVIGSALCKIYQFLGYQTIGINHLGDWGTQFGKLIEGYKRWGTEYNIEENPIDELVKIYVRINECCEKDESILEECRNNFKKLEDGDPYCRELWKKFRELSLKEFDRIYQMLGTKFDSNNGEAFYTDKMGEVVDILQKNGKLKESDGALIVDLEEKGMAPCIIGKTNGSTTYATRDLAAILYRTRTYDFEKALYVTSYEQTLHFKQVFEVAKLLGIDEKYTNNLIHVPFGMVHLPTGKMSTREGNVIKLEDLIKEAITRVKQIIESKNPDLENKDEIAKKIGIGAIIFNDLANSRIKDEIFDWDVLLNFNGETGPYIQYIYVRIKSVLEKAAIEPDMTTIDYSKLTDHESITVIKQLYEFQDIIKIAAEKNEPSIIARYLINLAQSFSNFYNNCQINVEQVNIKNARLCLAKATGMVLKKGTELLGIEMPDKM